MTLPACPRWFDGLPDPLPGPPPSVATAHDINIQATQVQVQPPDGSLPGGSPPGPPPAGAAATVTLDGETTGITEEVADALRLRLRHTEDLKRRF